MTDTAAAWRKSTYSGAVECVEVGQSWRKSAYSATGSCIEVGSYRKSTHSMNAGDCAEVGQSAVNSLVAVRDTKQAQLRDRTVLMFSPEAWQDFTKGLKSR
jgi:hypothetical protein